MVFFDAEAVEAAVASPRNVWREVEARVEYQGICSVRRSFDQEAEMDIAVEGPELVTLSGSEAHLVEERSIEEAER